MKSLPCLFMYPSPQFRPSRQLVSHMGRPMDRQGRKLEDPDQHSLILEEDIYRSSYPVEAQLVESGISGQENR